MTTFVAVCFPVHQELSENGSALIGKNLLLRGANSFLLEQTFFLGGEGGGEGECGGDGGKTVLKCATSVQINQSLNTCCHIRHFLFNQKLLVVFYFSMKICVVNTHKEHLTKALLTSTHNICFFRRNKKNITCLLDRPLNWSCAHVYGPCQVKKVTLSMCKIHRFRLSCGYAKYCLGLCSNLHSYPAQHDPNGLTGS